MQGLLAGDGMENMLGGVQAAAIPLQLRQAERHHAKEAARSERLHAEAFSQAALQHAEETHQGCHRLKSKRHILSGLPPRLAVHAVIYEFGHSQQAA